MLLTGPDCVDYEPTVFRNTTGRAPGIMAQTGRDVDETANAHVCTVRQKYIPNIVRSSPRYVLIASTCEVQTPNSSRGELTRAPRLLIRTLHTGAFRGADLVPFGFSVRITKPLCMHVSPLAAAHRFGSTRNHAYDQGDKDTPKIIFLAELPSDKPAARWSRTQ